MMNQPVNPPQQCTTASQCNAPVDDIRRQIGRRPFQGVMHCVHNLRQRVLQRLTDLLRSNGNRLRQTAEQISSLNFDGKLTFSIPIERDRAADFNFNPFCRRLTDQQIKVLPYIGNNSRVKFVAANPDTS